MKTNHCHNFYKICRLRLTGKIKWKGSFGTWYGTAHSIFSINGHRHRKNLLTMQIGATAQSKPSNFEVASKKTKCIVWIRPETCDQLIYSPSSRQWSRGVLHSQSCWRSRFVIARTVLLLFLPVVRWYRWVNKKKQTENLFRTAPWSSRLMPEASRWKTKIEDENTMKTELNSEERHVIGMMDAGINA